jgi:high-affinity iron transporter
LGIILSIAVGGLFVWLGQFFDTIEGVGKIWESLMSLIAVWLIISFVVWMIRHGKHIKKHIENEAKMHLSPWWIMLMTTVCIAREGVEVAVFAYAGEYPCQGIFLGILIAIVTSLILYIFSFRSKLTFFFNITLLYLILQCGYLFWYSIHEGLSALKELKILDGHNFIFTKVFDLSKTLLNHKEGIVWLPLNIIFGWYAKPEWIQFLAQYFCTGTLLWMWVQSKITKN